MRAIIVAIALLLAACAGAPVVAPATTTAPLATVSPTPSPTPRPSPETHGITGELQVSGIQNLNVDRCSPNSGYEDVNEGANIVVKDGAGAVVATSTLALNHSAQPSDFPEFVDPEGGYPCLFTWSATVPKADFYHVTIGRRDGPTISYPDLAAASWTWSLQIGVPQ